MASKLFAFNVSRKIDPIDEKTDSLWKGDTVAHLTTELGFCSSGQGYGVAFCGSDTFGCFAYSGGGLYICDITRYD